MTTLKEFTIGLTKALIGCVVLTFAINSAHSDALSQEGGKLDSGPLVEMAKGYGRELKAYGPETGIESVAEMYADISMCRGELTPVGDMANFVTAISAYPEYFLDSLGDAGARRFAKAYHDKVGVWGAAVADMTDTQEAVFKSIACSTTVENSEGLLIKIN